MPLCPLVQRITIPPPFIPSTSSFLAQVASDSLNTRVSKDTEMTHHVTLVDDSLMAENHCRMTAATNHSTGAAYIVLSNLEPFRHESYLSEGKMIKQLQPVCII